MSDRSASAAKFSAVRIAGSPLRNAMPHRPHFASADILPSGTRFVVPHAAQPTILLFEFDIEIPHCSFLLTRQTSHVGDSRSRQFSRCGPADRQFAACNFGSVCAVRQADRALRRNKRDLVLRSEEHTSELQSLMRISYAVFCFKTKSQL